MKIRRLHLALGGFALALVIWKSSAGTAEGTFDVLERLRRLEEDVARLTRAGRQLRNQILQLQNDNAAQQQQIAAMQGSFSVLDADVAMLSIKVSDLESIAPTAEQSEILGSLSLVDVPDGTGGSARTIRISGVNVQIVNGSGATNGNPGNPNAFGPAGIGCDERQSRQSERIRPSRCHGQRGGKLDRRLQRAWKRAR